VAFGVLSGLPAPTDDCLAFSARKVSLALARLKPNPAQRPGGCLIEVPALSDARSMAFTSSTFPARYGSDESAGFRLPANVSRNTPATEAGGL